MDNKEFLEKENKTYEVSVAIKDDSNYIKRRIKYRFWEAGDGDWELILLDSEDNYSARPLIWIPKKVIDKIINATVKKELKR